MSLFSSRFPARSLLNSLPLDVSTYTDLKVEVFFHIIFKWKLDSFSTFKKIYTNLHSQIIDNFDFTIQSLTFSFPINSLLCHFKLVSYLSILDIKYNDTLSILVNWILFKKLAVKVAIVKVKVDKYL
jgi:hypothetical protein